MWLVVRSGFPMPEGRIRWGRELQMRTKFCAFTITAPVALPLSVIHSTGMNFFFSLSLLADRSQGLPSRMVRRSRSILTYLLIGVQMYEKDSE